MAIIGNFFWFIIWGWFQALIWLILAGIFAITIIGLPIARAFLEFAKLTAFPFGKEIVRDTELYGKENVSIFSKIISVILNIIWFPVGLTLCIVYFTSALAWFVTIIFIPFGIICFRMGKFIIFPIGVRVVKKGQVALNAYNRGRAEGNSARSSHTNKKCRQCETIYNTGLNCPSCGSSLYEEVSRQGQTTIPQISPINRNYGDTWTCKNCNETNPITSSSCKGCGEYK